MASQITVLIKGHPQGGVSVDRAPKSREEYLSAFTKAIMDKAPLLSVVDVDGDVFNFVPSEIQGFTVISLD